MLACIPDAAASVLFPTWLFHIPKADGSGAGGVTTFTLRLHLKGAI